MSNEIRTLCADDKLVEERRKHIAECAVKMFVENGYKATTMRELARKCGMAQGLIYHYIGTKADILHLICQYAASGGPLMRDHLANLGKVSTTEALEACISKYYTWADKDQENYLFFSREIINFSPEDREMLLRSQVEIIELFTELVERGVAQGEFVADHPRLIGHNIVIQGYEWATRRWYLRPFFTLQEYIAAQTDVIMSTLGRPPSSMRCGERDQGEAACISPSRSNAGSPAARKHDAGRLPRGARYQHNI